MLLGSVVLLSRLERLFKCLYEVIEGLGVPYSSFFFVLVFDFVLKDTVCPCLETVLFFCEDLFVVAKV